MNYRTKNTRSKSIYRVQKGLMNAIDRILIPELPLLEKVVEEAKERNIDKTAYIFLDLNFFPYLLSAPAFVFIGLEAGASLLLYTLLRTIRGYQLGLYDLYKVFGASYDSLENKGQNEGNRQERV